MPEPEFLNPADNRPRIIGPAMVTVKHVTKEIVILRKHIAVAMVNMAHILLNHLVNPVVVHFFCIIAVNFDEMKINNREIIFEGWKDVGSAILCFIGLATLVLLIVFTVQIPRLVEIRRIEAETIARHPEAVKKEQKDDAKLIFVPNPALGGQPTPVFIP